MRGRGDFLLLRALNHKSCRTVLTQVRWCDDVGKENAEKTDPQRVLRAYQIEQSSSVGRPADLRVGRDDFQLPALDRRSLELQIRADVVQTL